jgi:hypothetical protein
VVSMGQASRSKLMATSALLLSLGSTPPCSGQVARPTIRTLLYLSSLPPAPAQSCLLRR